MDFRRSCLAIAVLLVETLGPPVDGLLEGLCAEDCSGGAWLVFEDGAESDCGRESAFVEIVGAVAGCSSEVVAFVPCCVVSDITDVSGGAVLLGLFSVFLLLQ